MKPDALKGIKHTIKEETVIEATLKPFEHLTPPPRPNALSVYIYNMDPNDTYVVRISKIVDLVKLPKHK